jgi:hypothetical protein
MTYSVVNCIKYRREKLFIGRKEKSVNKRREDRISIIIPIEFNIVNKEKEIVWKSGYQGYTRDINKSGLCIEVVNLDENVSEKLAQGEYGLFLNIIVPNREEPITSYVSVKWIKKNKDSFPLKFHIGVQFESISENDINTILKYVVNFKQRPKKIASIAVVLLFIAFYSLVNNFKIEYDNKQLVKKIEQVNYQKNKIDQEIQKVENLKISLEQNLWAAATQIDNLSTQLSEVADAKVTVLESKIGDLRANKENLQKALDKILSKEKELVLRREVLKRSKINLLNKNTLKMYNWIKINQNDKTGLVPSFEGDPDLENFAFTYDEALVIMNFIANNDLDEAKKGLDFFLYKARKYDGGYLNAYECVQGRVVEWTAHVGPNCWLGMAALHYYEATKSKDYLIFAENIGNWILKYQDQEGGIKGGPTVSWYATEHNVDCYAFFRMLYTETQDQKYFYVCNSILKWLKKYIYNKTTNQLYRGKNDNFIATDSVSFTIPALGPKLLYKMGFDPEAMIRFIESKVKVTTSFTNRQHQEIPITGFDYTYARNIGRPPVVSSEWTAQMVTTYNTMAEYFQNKDKAKSEKYRKEAIFYLAQLDNMLIMQPYSKLLGGGLPYATGTGTDTGHGWLTPKSPFSISVAGTAYTLFARNKINPFCLDSEKKEYN